MKQEFPRQLKDISDEDLCDLAWEPELLEGLTSLERFLLGRLAEARAELDELRAHRERFPLNPAFDEGSESGRFQRHQVKVGYAMISRRAT